MNNSISRSGNSNSTSSSSSSRQACAACKHQRRKCRPNCILAPYFPHDSQKEFLNAHKLFGVGKISSMIKHLSPADRDTAMKTIIYQADMRDFDPVGGCYRLIQELQSQIDYHHAELQLVLQQLAMFTAQSHREQVHQVLAPTTTRANVGFDDIDDPSALYDAANNNFTPQQCHDSTSFNSSHEDLNTWILQNSMSLSPLVSSNENGNTINDDYLYHQRSMLDLGNLETKH